MSTLFLLLKKPSADVYMGSDYIFAGVYLSTEKAEEAMQNELALYNKNGWKPDFNIYPMYEGKISAHPIPLYNPDFKKEITYSLNKG